MSHTLSLAYTNTQLLLSTHLGWPCLSLPSLSPTPLVQTRSFFLSPTNLGMFYLCLIRCWPSVGGAAPPVRSDGSMPPQQHALVVLHLVRGRDMATVTHMLVVIISRSDPPNQSIIYAASILRTPCRWSHTIQLTTSHSTDLQKVQFPVVSTDLACPPVGMPWVETACGGTDIPLGLLVRTDMQTLCNRHSQLRPGVNVLIANIILCAPCPHHLGSYIPAVRNAMLCKYNFAVQLNRLLHMNTRYIIICKQLQLTSIQLVRGLI